MIRKVALFTCALILVSACAVGPDYEKPEAEVPGSWRFEYSDNAEIVNTVWWKQFQDPVLDELIQTALQNNRDVRIAAARVEEFAARVDIARSGFYPQIGYQGDGNRNKISDNSLSNLPPGYTLYQQ
jgi:multidrug efflux system outer membrane protein